nr:unnamed protein product [Digitaria exilis]
MCFDPRSRTQTGHNAELPTGSSDAWRWHAELPFHAILPVLASQSRGLPPKGATTPATTSATPRLMTRTRSRGQVSWSPTGKPAGRQLLGQPRLGPNQTHTAALRLIHDPTRDAQGNDRRIPESPAAVQQGLVDKRDPSTTTLAWQHSQTGCHATVNTTSRRPEYTMTGLAEGGTAAPAACPRRRGRSSRQSGGSGGGSTDYLPTPLPAPDTSFARALFGFLATKLLLFRRTSFFRSAAARRIDPHRLLRSAPLCSTGSLSREKARSIRQVATARLGQQRSAQLTKWFSTDWQERALLRGSPKSVDLSKEIPASSRKEIPILSLRLATKSRSPMPPTHPRESPRIPILSPKSTASADLAQNPPLESGPRAPHPQISSTATWPEEFDAESERGSTGATDAKKFGLDGGATDEGRRDEANNYAARVVRRGASPVKGYGNFAACLCGGRCVAMLPSVSTSQRFHLTGRPAPIPAKVDVDPGLPPCGPHALSPAPPHNPICSLSARGRQPLLSLPLASLRLRPRQCVAGSAGFLGYYPQTSVRGHNQGLRNRREPVVHCEKVSKEVREYFQRELERAKKVTAQRAQEKLRKEKVAAEGNYPGEDKAYHEEAELQRALNQSRAEEEFRRGVQQRGGAYEHRGGSGTRGEGTLQRMLRRATSSRQTPGVTDYNLAKD